MIVTSSLDSACEGSVAPEQGNASEIGEAAYGNGNHLAALADDRIDRAVDGVEGAGFTR